MRSILLFVAAGLLGAGCGSSGVVQPADQVSSTRIGGGDCADVVSATATADGPGTWTIAATVRSADTGWEKYADAWEVVGPDGTVYGRRELAHPHTNEQPFTRSLSEVEVPDGVGEVTIRARDSVEGLCGETATVSLEP
jgi:hypothetical protein